MTQGWVRCARIGALLFGLLMGLLLAAGCSRLTPYEVDQHEIERAEQLMAQGQHVEAEQILLRLHQQQPQWPRPRVLLAAVEMSKMNFEATSIFPLIRTFVDEREAPALPADASRSRRALREIRGLLEEVELIVERFEKIPVTPREHVSTLDKAIDWIAPIENPSPGQALYRATLRVMAIKSRSLHMLSANNGPFSKTICDWKGQDFLNWVSKEALQVELTVQDLAIAFPKTGSSYDRFLVQLKNLITPVKGQVRPNNATIREILEERMFEMGLEELSPCA